MTADESWNSLPGMMLTLARQWPDRPMLRFWRNGAWQGMSWAEYALAVAAIAAGLRLRGVGPGDRVLIVSENRPEFLIADTAIMAIGAVSVPTYTTNTVADHAHVLRDSGARFAIVSTLKLAQSVREAAGDAGLDLLVAMEGTDGVTPWSELASAPADLPMLAAEADQIPIGRLACLIYTSGTGGAPKGVMLPHRAMLANRRGVNAFIQKLHLPQDACYLSFLPLSHAYEHTVGGFLMASYGMEVVYSRGAEKLAAELQQIRPAIVTSVPRLFEVLRARILAGLEKQSKLQRRAFDIALALGLRRMDGPPLNLWEKLQDAVVERLVRTKVQARFGGRIQAFVSGGARLDPGLSGFFIALGLPLIQGYGQTEAGPVISVNPPWDNHRHTVGHLLQDVEARIAPDGEVLVRGPLVMDGYWNNPAATAEALVDLHDGGAPWLHTGDVGEITAGFLRITDRKRDIIKTLGGDMISPARIEGMLMAEPEIAQAVVAGDGRPGIAALLVAAEGQEANLANAVKRVNATLSSIERIRYTLPVPAFTAENGLLTPTMKIKRRVVLKEHDAALNSLYTK
jgi:long-chain acyl-CoA synthetase